MFTMMKSNSVIVEDCLNMKYIFYLSYNLHNLAVVCAKFDIGTKFSKRVENTVGKGEIAC